MTIKKRNYKRKKQETRQEKGKKGKKKKRKERNKNSEAHYNFCCVQMDKGINENENINIVLKVIRPSIVIIGAHLLFYTFVYSKL